MSGAGARRIARVFGGGTRTPAPWWADLLAPASLMLAPFLSFLQAHEYSLLRFESLAIAAALVLSGLLAGWFIHGRRDLLRVPVLAALLALFVNFSGGYGFAEWALALALLGWMLRRHLSEIVAVMGVVLLATTVLVPPVSVHAARADDPAAADLVPDRSLPPVLHLVLDEHIGIEGLPQDSELGRRVRRELREFYGAYGFELAGGAYSQYFKTMDSLGNLFNFSSSHTHARYFPRGSPRDPYVLEQNRYFDLLAERGYLFRIYQSGFMDFCATPGIQVIACRRYFSNSIKSIEPLELAPSQRLLFVANSYLRTSRTVRQVRRVYRDLRQALERIELRLPVWNDSFRVGALALLPVLAQLREDLAGDARGQVYFAHLLLPHYPYVFQPDCSINRRVSQWWYRQSLRAHSPDINSPETRARRYARYFVQLRCQQRLLGELFEAMRAAGVFDDAIVVLHGDHGSRIGIRDPRARHRAALSHDDLVDAYSTLFALRAPGRAGAYRSEPAPLQNLLAELMQQPAPVSEPRVYLIDRPHGRMLALPVETLAREP